MLGRHSRRLLCAHHRSLKPPHVVLGIPANASEAQIKESFHKLARSYHPDMPGGNIKKFQEVNAAYAIMKNNRKKASKEEDVEFKKYGGAERAREHFRTKGPEAPAPNLSEWELMWATDAIELLVMVIAVTIWAMFTLHRWMDGAHRRSHNRMQQQAIMPSNSVKMDQMLRLHQDELASKETQQALGAGLSKDRNRAPTYINEVGAQIAEAASSSGEPLKRDPESGHVIVQETTTRIGEVPNYKEMKEREKQLDAAYWELRRATVRRFQDLREYLLVFDTDHVTDRRVTAMRVAPDLIDEDRLHLRCPIVETMDTFEDTRAYEDTFVRAVKKLQTLEMRNVDAAPATAMMMDAVGKVQAYSPSAVRGTFFEYRPNKERYPYCVAVVLNDKYPKGQGRFQRITITGDETMQPERLMAREEAIRQGIVKEKDLLVGGQVPIKDTLN